MRCLSSLIYYFYFIWKPISLFQSFYSNLCSDLLEQSVYCCGLIFFKVCLILCLMLQIVSYSLEVNHGLAVAFKAACSPHSPSVLWQLLCAAALSMLKCALLRHLSPGPGRSEYLAHLSTHRHLEKTTSSSAPSQFLLIWIFFFPSAIACVLFYCVDTCS